MPEEPTPENQALSSKVQISKVKTGLMKKGCSKQKNLLSVKKKDLLSRQLQPPQELMMFLQANDTSEAILQGHTCEEVSI